MSEFPRYKSLCVEILEDMGRGQFSDGCKAKDLAKQYQVSLTTIFRALRILRDAGVINMGSGRLIRVCSMTNNQFNSSNIIKSPVSAPEKLAADIEKKIAEGVFKQGMEFPKATYLSNTFRVSSHTVAKAFHILRKKNLVYKDGNRWIAGKPIPPIPHYRSPATYAPLVICIPQLTPNAFSELCGDAIWGKFANSFIAEAEKQGIQMQQVLFDPTSALPGSPSGPEQFARYVKKKGARCLGAMIVSPRSERYTQLTEEWIRFSSQYCQQVIWLCSSLDWPIIEKHTESIPNSVLTLYSEFATQTHPGIAGEAIQTLEKFGHKNILFLDTLTNKEKWLNRCLKHLKYHINRMNEKVSFEYVKATKRFSFTDSQEKAETILKMFRKTKRGLGGSVTLPQVRKRLLNPDLRYDSFRELVEDAAIMLPAIKKFQPTAIIAPNDIRGRRYYNLLNTLGIAVPGEMSLLSFDNAPFLRLMPVSSIDFGMDTLGYKTLHAFLKDIPSPVLGKRICSMPQVNHHGSIGKPRTDPLKIDLSDL